MRKYHVPFCRAVEGATLSLTLTTATSDGTPQGGVVSPLLANIALHGIENRLMDFAKTIDMRRKDKPKSSLLEYQNGKASRNADLKSLQT